MARTIAEIKSGLLAEHNNRAELASLNSTSQTSIYGALYSVIAVCVFVLESLWDVFKTDIEVTIYNTIPGTERWYYEKCLEFQYGDSLQWIDNRFQFLSINEASKIIKRVAVKQLNGKVYIKVAKLNNGVPEALNSVEFAAFNAYMQQIKYAGTQLVIISGNADKLALFAVVQYDPLLLDNSGVLISDGSTKPVEVAINNYIAGIKFGGVYNRTKCVDEIQKATGVIDAVLYAAYIDSNNVVHIFFQNYEAPQGYFKIENMTIVYYPTSDQISNIFSL